MRTTSFYTFYGLRAPRDFGIAIPFLLSACAAIATLMVSLWLAANNALYAGTARFYFLSYIFVLLAMGAVFSRMRRLSWALFLWCVFEAALAFISTVLAVDGGGRSWFPKNEFVLPADPRASYHILLQRVLTPNLHWVHQYDTRNKTRFLDFPIRWSYLEGKGFVYQQNSLGMRGRELGADDLARDLIFVYGGSTTYDWYVSQGDTWVELLQAALAGKYALLNLGVPGYSSAENLVQTAFYQDDLPKKPVCAIYYVGWNDIMNAHVPNLDPAYAPFHFALLTIHKPDLYFSPYSPFMMALNVLMQERFDTVPRPLITLAVHDGVDSGLEKSFVGHIETIIAINSARGIRSIFIGQMLNRELGSRLEDRNVFVPLVRKRDVWPLQSRFNRLLEKAAASSDTAKYIDPGIEHFTSSDFVDLGHFTADGSRKFSMLISDKVNAYCRP